MMPADALRLALRAFARPKSMSFTSPSYVTNTLLGFTSRWIDVERLAVVVA